MAYMTSYYDVFRREASFIDKSGTRLDPIIIGILVSSLHAMEL
jgi:hypothetical protein